MTTVSTFATSIERVEETQEIVKEVDYETVSEYDEDGNLVSVTTVELATRTNAGVSHAD